MSFFLSQVGGSGKQSLARLGAFLSSLSVYQIQLRKGYNIADLRFDLNALYHKVGVKNISMMFLLTDAQVADESFLVLINDMLASGEVQDLFTDDEIENITKSVKNEVKQFGFIDTKESCWKYFIDKVKRMLKVDLNTRRFPPKLHASCSRLLQLFRLSYAFHQLGLH